MTAAEINALPEPVRSYIFWLETDADPAGTLRENWTLHQENKALRALLADSEALSAAAEEAARGSAEHDVALRMIAPGCNLSGQLKCAGVDLGIMKLTTATQSSHVLHVLIPEEVSDKVLSEALAGHSFKDATAPDEGIRITRHKFVGVALVYPSDAGVIGTFFTKLLSVAASLPNPSDVIHFCHEMPVDVADQPRTR